MPTKINITTWSIFKLILIIIGFWFLYILRDIVGLVFVAIFFAAAITPIVDWFAKKKIPRSVAMIIIYLGLFVVVAAIVGFLVPPIYHQINEVSDKFPEYYNYISEGLIKMQGSNGDLDISRNIANIISQVSGKAGSGLLSLLSSLFGGVVFFVVVLVIIFYMSVEENAIEKIVKTIVPEQYEKDITCLLYRIQEKLGLWLHNVLLLGLIIAVMTFLILLPVLPKYALILALFAGLVEFIPYMGPFLGAIPAIFLASSLGSSFTIIYVVIAYIIIQQAENHLIVPQVMKRAVGLNPIVSIIAIMVGARLGQFLEIGAIVGVLLALPTTITVFEVIDFFADRKKARKQCDIKS